MNPTENEKIKIITLHVEIARFFLPSLVRHASRALDSVYIPIRMWLVSTERSVGSECTISPTQFSIPFSKYQKLFKIKLSSPQRN